jgi:hypothetical protein
LTSIIHKYEISPVPLKKPHLCILAMINPQSNPINGQVVLYK